MVLRRRLPRHVYALTLGGLLLWVVSVLFGSPGIPIGSPILVDVPANRIRDASLMVSFHVPKEDYTPARQRQLGAVAYLVVVVGLGDDIKCLDKLGLSVSRVTTEGNAPLKPVNQNPYGHSQFESCRDYNALQVEGKPEEYVLLAVNGSSSNLPQNGRLLVVKHWKNVKDALVGESIERSIQPYARAGHAIAAALLAYVLIRLIVAAHTVGG